MLFAYNKFTEIYLLIETECHTYTSWNYVIIGLDHGLSPVRHQAIIETKDGVLLVGPFGTNFGGELNRKSIKENTPSRVVRWGRSLAGVRRRIPTPDASKWSPERVFTFYTVLTYGINNKWCQRILCSFLRYRLKYGINVFMQENWIANVVCEMAAILSQPQFGKYSMRIRHITISNESCREST